MQNDFRAERAASLVARFMTLIGPSLACYIDDSGIWSRPGAEAIKLALADLSSDLRSLYERAGLLHDRLVEYPSPQVEYPIRFSALHDIDLGYLLPQLLAEGREQVAAVDAMAATEASAEESVAEVVEFLREAHTAIQSHVDVLAGLADAPQAAARA